MKYLALLVIAAAALPGGASARDTGPLLRYQLDNGLDVILAPDSRVPKVVVDIAYKVGAVNEPPGRSGFAHLFEHMMFKATKDLPSESIDRFTEDVGGVNNASTYDDFTNYYEVVPANHLERPDAILCARAVLDAALHAGRRGRPHGQPGRGDH